MGNSDVKEIEIIVDGFIQNKIFFIIIITIFFLFLFIYLFIFFLHLLATFINK